MCLARNPFTPAVHDPKIVTSGANGVLTIWDPQAFEQVSRTEADKCLHSDPTSTKPHRGSFSSH